MTQPTHFCTQCGKPVYDGSAYCPGCGQPQLIQQPIQQPAQQPAHYQHQQPQPASAAPRRRRPSVILLLAGLLLFLFGLRIPAAQLFGTSTAGIITNVEQEISSSSERMDYNYNINYTFDTGTGKSQSGSFMMMHVYNIRNLPSEGSMVVVQYLPGLPFVNFAEGQESIGVSTILTLALGIILIILGASGVGHVSFRRRP